MSSTQQTTTKRVYKKQPAVLKAFLTKEEKNGLLKVFKKQSKATAHSPTLAKAEKLAAKETAKAEKLAAKEAAKAEKLAVKEAAKIEKLVAKEEDKADKLAKKEAAKEVAKAEKLAAKEITKAEKLAAKETAKAEKLAAKKASKTEVKISTMNEKISKFDSELKKAAGFKCINESGEIVVETIMDIDGDTRTHTLWMTCSDYIKHVKNTEKRLIKEEKKLARDQAKIKEKEAKKAKKLAEKIANN